MLGRATSWCLADTHTCISDNIYDKDAFSEMIILLQPFHHLFINEALVNILSNNNVTPHPKHLLAWLEMWHEANRYRPH